MPAARASDQRRPRAPRRWPGGPPGRSDTSTAPRQKTGTPLTDQRRSRRRCDPTSTVRNPTSPEVEPCPADHHRAPGRGAGRRGCGATTGRRRRGVTSPDTTHPPVVDHAPRAGAARPGHLDLGPATPAGSAATRGPGRPRASPRPCRARRRRRPGRTRPRTRLVTTSTGRAGRRRTGRHGPTGAGITAQPAWRPSSVVRIHRRFWLDTPVVFHRGRGRRCARTGVRAANRMHSSLSVAERGDRHPRGRRTSTRSAAGGRR